LIGVSSLDYIEAFVAQIVEAVVIRSRLSSSTIKTAGLAGRPGR
jgi:hypothetical protein